MLSIFFQCHLLVVALDLFFGLRWLEGRWVWYGNDSQSRIDIIMKFSLTTCLLSFLFNSFQSFSSKYMIVLWIGLRGALFSSTAVASAVFSCLNISNPGSDNSSGSINNKGQSNLFIQRSSGQK